MITGFLFLLLYAIIATESILDIAGATVNIHLQVQV